MAFPRIPGFNRSAAEKALAPSVDALGEVEAQLKKVQAQLDAKKLEKLKDPLQKELLLLTGKKNKLVEEKKVQDELQKKQDALAKKQLDQEKEKKKATQRTVDQLKTVALAYTMVAVAMAKSAVESTVGKALDAAQFKEDSAFALRFAIGSAEGAKTTFGYVNSIANTLGVSSREAMGQFRKILSTGVREGEAQQLTQLSQDILKASGADVSGALGAAVMALKKNAPVTVDSFAALKEAGLSDTRINELLAKKLNVQEKDDNKRAQKVQQALARQNLRGQKALDFWGQVMLDATGKDKAGALAQEKQNTTVTGSLDKLQNRWNALIDAINTGGAGAGLIKVVQTVANAIDPTTASGKKLLATLDRVATVAGQALGSLDPDEVVGALLSVADALDDILAMAKSLGGGAWQGFKEAKQTIDEVKASLGMLTGSGIVSADTLKSIGKAAGYFAVGLIAVVGIVTGFAGLVIEAVMTLPKGLKEVGGWAIDGLVDGFKAKWGALKSAVTDIKDTVVNGLRGAFVIRSPSKLMRSLGGHVGEGFALGIQDGAGDVEATAKASLVDPVTGTAASGAPRSAGAGGGGAPASFVFAPNITIVAPAGGDLEAIKAMLLEAMREQFRQACAELGAVVPT